MEGITVTVRPETVSWETVSQVLREAHRENVRQGIRMTYPNLPPQELWAITEGRGGTLYLASDGDRVVGTAAVVRIDKAIWCGDGAYAYCFLDAVVPDYAGKGVFRQLAAAQERWARAAGISRLLLDTNERNRPMLRLCRKNGWRAVDYRIHHGYSSVMLVRWLDGCPYSPLYCRYKYLWMKWARKRKQWKNSRTSS